MSQTVTSHGILHDMFAPPPETRSEPPKKDLFDHVADYANTSSGSWDVFRVGNHIFSALEMMYSPSDFMGELAAKTNEVFNTAGIALSIPQLVSDLNSLRNSISNLFSVQDLPVNDPLKTCKIAQAAKKTFLDTNTLTNTAAQIALFVENVKLFIFDPIDLRITDGIYNLTSAIGDGVELVGEYFKLQHYESAEVQPRNAAELAKIEEKKTLAWMTIAKDVSSIALAAIALGSIVFGVATCTISCLPVVILTISAFWLTMKLTAYFYDKVIVEAPAQNGLLASSS